MNALLSILLVFGFVIGYFTKLIWLMITTLGLLLMWHEREAFAEMRGYDRRRSMYALLLLWYAVLFGLAMMLFLIRRRLGYWPTIGSITGLATGHELLFPRFRVLLRSRFATGSFHEYVRNPRAQQSAEDYGASLAAITVPENPTNAEIEAVIAELLDPLWAQHGAVKLRMIGDAARAHLVKALEDPAFCADPNEEVAWNHPLTHILTLLNQSPPSAMTPVILALAQHPSWRIRHDAIRLLGNIGTSDCVEPIAAAIRSDRPWDRYWGVSAALQACSRDHGAQELSVQLVEPVKATLDCATNEMQAVELAAKFLLRHAAEAYLPLMLSEKYLNPHYQHADEVVAALADELVPLPCERLLATIRELLPLKEHRPAARGARILKALVAQKCLGVLPLVELAMRSEVEYIASSGTELWAEMNGVVKPWDFVLRKIDTNGYESLTEPQRLLHAASLLDAEVCNGGFSQFFVNSSGDHAQDAAAGFAALGMAAAYETAVKAIAVFGAKGCPTQREVRRKRIASFSKSQHNLLYGLDSDYYKAAADFPIMKSRYAVAHQDHFSPHPADSVDDTEAAGH